MSHSKAVIRLTLLVALALATAAGVAAQPASASDIPAVQPSVVAAGGAHTCAIVSDGRVQCWGDGSFGQLGNGAFTDSTTPTYVAGLTNAIEIAAGLQHTCALTSGGDVLCWGRNNVGQVGDGTTTNRNTAVNVPQTNVTQIAAGNFHTCVIRAEGVARCWGENGNGQLGDGTTVDSTLPVVVTGLTRATSIAAGGAHSCVTRTTGTGVACWGANASGQLGDGTTTQATTFVQYVNPVSDTPITVAAGSSHTCTLFADGEVYCWGENGSSQLGDGTTTDRLTATNVIILNGAMDIDAGSNHTCALVSSSGNNGRCWGANTQGQGGNGTTTNLLTATAVSGLTSAVGLSGGDQHTCYMRGDARVLCTGDNSQGQLGNNSTVDSLVIVDAVSFSVAVGVTWRSHEVSAGETSTCAAVADGAVRCWGNNGLGELGDGTTTSKPAPVLAKVLNTNAGVSAGSVFNCAMPGDGTVQCWGSGFSGQLGNGSTSNRSTPVPVTGITTATAISAGLDHACALLSDGTARCWGENGSGQLGDGTTTDRLTPVAVSVLSGAVAIAAGSNHTCAIIDGGGVRCWGDNAFGQLGDGTNFDSSIPTTASGVSDAVDIDTGWSHTCVAESDGSVGCWGLNSSGQLGDGTTTNRNTQVPVSGMTVQWIDVDLGAAHSCARAADGEVRCWGENGAGALGDGTTTDRLMPVTAAITDVASISAGANNTCAVRGSGEIRCWGDNALGQLGIGTTGADSSVPVAVRWMQWLIRIADPLANSFIGIGPTGGSWQSTSVPAGVLRLVECDGTNCPALGSGVGQLWEDNDDDGLPNSVEATWWSDTEDPDTDNDGLNDFEELAFGTDPDLADTDGDGSLASGARTDAVDNCRLIANATQADADADGVGDPCDDNDSVDNFPGGANNDGDGLAVIKSTAAGTYGAAELTNYGAAGLGGCSAAEETANGTSDDNPRDFADVNNSGKVDGTDIGMVRSAFNATAGISAVYKRTLDINAASSSGGLGSGKIDGTDIGIVRSQFNKSCTAAP